MPVYRYDPPERFVAGTVGEPGERTFFLQAVDAGRITSVVLEKSQVAALAERVEELLDEVSQRFGTETGGEGEVDDDPLQQPLEEDFRVGTMALAWDPEAGQVIIEAQEVTADPPEEPTEEVFAEESSGEVLRVHLTPEAARSFARRAQRVVGRRGPPGPPGGAPRGPPPPFASILRWDRPCTDQRGLHMKNRVLFPLMGVLALGILVGCGATGEGARTDTNRLTTEEIASVDVSTLFEGRGGNHQLDGTARFRDATGHSWADRGGNAVWNPDASYEEQAAFLGQFLGTRAGYIHPADFWRWRELAFTLMPPEAWTQRFPTLRGASLTLAGRNLATWTDYPGIDPEINETGSSSNFTQAEFNTQPPVRYLTARFNFSF
jgi:uncharacterized repeat protein (TIGR03847 family)